MTSSVESNSMRENWFDSVLNIVEKAVSDLFDDDPVGKKSTQTDEPLSHGTYSKLESPNSRGQIGRASQKQRQKNQVSKYLTQIPATPQRNLSKKKRKNTRTSHEQRISNSNEKSRTTPVEGGISPQVSHERMPIELAELEIPDDASEVTLPVALRHNLFGIDFTPKKKYDDVTQPELENRRLAMVLERKEKDLSSDATSGEQTVSIDEENSPTAHASAVTKNDTVQLVNAKADERDFPQSLQRGIEVQSARDLEEDLQFSNPCSRDVEEDLQLPTPPSRDLGEHLQFSNATIRILSQPSFEVIHNPKPRVSDKYAPFQAKASDISRKEMRLRCLDKNSSTWIPGVQQETGISSPVRVPTESESEERASSGEAKGALAYTPPVERATIEEQEMPRKSPDVDTSHAMFFPPGKVVVLQPGSLRL